MIDEIRRVSGWNVPPNDGGAIEDEMRVHVSWKQDGLYEVDFAGDPLNIELGSDYSGTYIVILSIDEGKRWLK
jgi:hypothetical protein